MRQELQAEPAPNVARRYETEVPTGGRLPIDDLVELREITVHTVEWRGDEPTVIAIHGSAQSAYSLTVLAAWLAPDVPVITADLRGHGLSDKPPGVYHVRRHAADIQGTHHETRSEVPVLLGFLVSGAIATLVASDSNEIGGLILLEGVGGDLAFTSNSAAHQTPPTNPAGVEMTERFGGFGEYLTQWRADQPSRSTVAELLLERVVRYELEPLHDGTYRRRGLRQAWKDTWSSLTDIDSLALFRRVRCPVLIVQPALGWIGGEPYLSDALIDAQCRVARHATHHGVQTATIRC